MARKPTSPPTRTGTADRLPLDRDRVLKTAVAFADEHGIESLSMRKLAKELGFEVMSLYNHVANKQDMLDGMVDVVASQIELPASGGDWKQAMRRSSISAHAVLVSHAWAPSTWWQASLGPARQDYMESILRCLRQSGMSLELTYHAYHALTMHVVGFALQQLNFVPVADDLPALAEKFLAEFPTDEFPYLAEHIGQHIADDEADEFEYVLDLLLDGLDRLHRQP